MRHHLHPIAWVAAFCFAGAQPSSAGESLSQALQNMFDYEPELRAAGYDTIATGHDQKMVRADLMPQVNVSGSAGLYNRDRSIDGLEKSTGSTLFSRQIGVNMRQLLFDFGEAGNRNQSAKNRTLMQGHLEDAMVEGRSVDLAEVFLEVLRLREQLRLSKGNLNEHQRVANAMRTKFENGGDRADVALVEGRLELAKTELESQVLALGQAEGRYLRLTGNKPGDLTKPTPPQIPRTREEISLSDNWYIRAADEAVKMAQATRKADSKGGAPKLFAEGGYSVGDDVLGIEGQDNEARALLVLSWNIFEGGRNKHRNLRGITLEKKAVELAHGADAEQNYQTTLIWSELVGAKNTITALKSYANRLNQVSADYDEQFELGKRDILSILDIQNERHSADSRLLDARYEEMASKFRLLGLQGRLVSTLVGERQRVSEPKRKGVFGNSDSKSAIPSPSPTMEPTIIPAISGEFAKAEAQAMPLDISFGAEKAEIKKAERKARTLFIGGSKKRKASALGKKKPKTVSKSPKAQEAVKVPALKKTEEPLPDEQRGIVKKYNFGRK